MGGFWYAIPLLTILLAHELGHFFISKNYGVVVTLPLFIPFPLSPFGTLGAIIKMSGFLPNRKALFDIGIAGPLAGLILTLPTIIIGLNLSQVVVLSELKEPVIPLGSSILFSLMEKIMFGPLPEGQDIILHPMAYAGWVGLFVTALNLLPIGQLDGGHIIYSLMGKKSKIVYYLTLTILGLICIFINPAWILLWCLLFLFGFKHPPTLDDTIPLDKKRYFLGFFILIFFILSFTPVPFRL
ncbi:MAG: site-2 protease family protein [Candidatus Caldatribacteriota bacterium]